MSAAPRFHDTYVAARRAFRQRSAALGFDQQAYDVGAPGPDGSECTLDVAVKSRGIVRKAFVVSSGTHGVEGYFGSAVQLDLLHGRLADWQPKDGEAVVLIHAVNPWGMAHERRVNEDGVDQNRNFRRDTSFSGAPDGYRQLDALLNPGTPPGGFDPFWLNAGVQIARVGFRALKEAVASGQYDYPGGLFYGGSGPTASQRLLRGAVTDLFAHAERVVQLDLHTGSGRWGTYVHAVDLPMGSDRVKRLQAEFGAAKVQALDPSGVLYTIHGALGPWLQSLLPDVTYDCLLTEFGTYSPLKVIANMRFENRVVRFAGGDPTLRAEAARRMHETFCPADAAWRSSCLKQAATCADQAMAAVFA
jgi:predicted deacylase